MMYYLIELKLIKFLNGCDNEWFTFYFARRASSSYQ